MNLDAHDLRRLIERTSAHAERGLETAYLLERVSECVPLGDLHTQLQEERKRVVDGIDDLEAATVGLRALLTTMTELDVYDVDELVETRLEQVQRMRDQLAELRDAAEPVSEPVPAENLEAWLDSPRVRALLDASDHLEGIVFAGSMELATDLTTWFTFSVTVPEGASAQLPIGSRVRLARVEHTPMAPPEEDAADHAPEEVARTAASSTAASILVPIGRRWLTDRAPDWSAP